MTKHKRHSGPAATVAAGLRSLAGHLYREARTMEPGEKNAYAEGLREAALIASCRAAKLELVSKAAAKKYRRKGKKR